MGWEGRGSQKPVGRERQGQRKQGQVLENASISMRLRGTQKGEVPEAAGTTLAAPPGKKMRRLCRLRHYPLRTWRETRSGRDRMGTGPNDALDVQGWRR